MSAIDASAAALLNDLNEPQRRAVMHRDGPLLVLAGPGSGKTRVITRRAAYLVHTGVPARNVLAITFTNKAAAEMRRRIDETGVARGMWVYTFHALGARLLREFGPLARVEPGFTIYDEGDQLKLIKEALERCAIAEHILRPELAQAEISKAKNRLLSPAELAERQTNSAWVDSQQRTVARVYDAYDQLLVQRNAVDFDDLLMRVAIVLRDHPEITERLNIRFRYVLIDEYQDTNHAQYRIARALSQHRNICATGDPDQSIYGWRGADLGNILDFERDYADATVVRLEQNYRSAANILKVASTLITGNRRRKEKDLWTHNAAGELVRVWQFAEGRDEAERIGDTIAALRSAGRAYSDFAIVYRVNAISRGLEESLRHRGIPYKIARGVEFYNRREIKDTLAYLHVLVNPADQISLLRIVNTPARGIGKTTIQRLIAAADAMGLPLMQVLETAEQYPELRAVAPKLAGFLRVLDKLRPTVSGPVADSVSAVLTLSGLERALKEEGDEEGEDRVANVQELVTAAARYDAETEEPSLADFLTRVSLTSDQDAVDESNNVVILMTLHAAKGLEFPVVFIVGLEQGMLPHERALQGDGDLEEERRLCFVGITRAKERLFISHARERFIRGALLPRSASQFLREIGGDAIKIEHFERSSGPAFDDDDRGNGFVPMDDHLPLDETRRPIGGLSRPTWRESDEYATEGQALTIGRRRAPTGANTRSDESTPAVRPASDSPYADWKPGMLVLHAKYGVGQVVWLSPSPGATRASIKFAGHGEKTFILELAPVKKLERETRR